MNQRRSYLKKGDGIKRFGNISYPVIANYLSRHKDSNVITMSEISNHKPSTEASDFVSNNSNTQDQSVTIDNSSSSNTSRSTSVDENQSNLDVTTTNNVNKSNLVDERRYITSNLSDSNCDSVDQSDDPSLILDRLRAEMHEQESLMELRNLEDAEKLIDENPEAITQDVLNLLFSTRLLNSEDKNFSHHLWENILLTNNQFDLKRPNTSSQITKFSDLTLGSKHHPLTPLPEESTHGGGTTPRALELTESEDEMPTYDVFQKNKVLLTDTAPRDGLETDSVTTICSADWQQEFNRQKLKEKQQNTIKVSAVQPTLLSSPVRRLKSNNVRHNGKIVKTKTEPSIVQLNTLVHPDRHMSSNNPDLCNELVEFENSNKNLEMQQEIIKLRMAMRDVDEIRNRLTSEIAELDREREKFCIEREKWNLHRETDDARLRADKNRVEKAEQAANKAISQRSNEITVLKKQIREQAQESAEKSSKMAEERTRLRHQLQLKDKECQNFRSQLDRLRSNFESTTKLKDKLEVENQHLRVRLRNFTMSASVPNSAASDSHSLLAGKRVRFSLPSLNNSPLKSDAVIQNFNGISNSFVRTNDKSCQTSDLNLEDYITSNNNITGYKTDLQFSPVFNLANNYNACLRMPMPLLNRNSTFNLPLADRSTVSLSNKNEGLGIESPMISTAHFASTFSSCTPELVNDPDGNNIVVNKTLERRLSCGSVEILYDVGTRELRRPDGHVTYWYKNGDQRQLRPDGSQIYRLADLELTVTTFSDGSRILHYDTGVLRREFVDGSIEWRQPDGTCSRKWPNGQMIGRLHPSGKSELRTDAWALIEMPDGRARRQWLSNGKDEQYDPQTGHYLVRDKRDGRVISDFIATECPPGLQVPTHVRTVLTRAKRELDAFIS